MMDGERSKSINITESWASRLMYYWRNWRAILNNFEMWDCLASLTVYLRDCTTEDLNWTAENSFCFKLFPNHSAKVLGSRKRFARKFIFIERNFSSIFKFSVEYFCYWNAHGLFFLAFIFMLLADERSKNLGQKAAM